MISGDWDCGGRYGAMKPERGATVLAAEELARDKELAFEKGAATTTR